MNTEQPNRKFIADDIADWKAYERVRKGGKWNMFDQRARRATGLSEERYTMSNLELQ